MKAVLTLELFGENVAQHIALAADMAEAACGSEVGDLIRWRPPRPWVAEINGTDPTYRLARTFLWAYKDYAKANSVGSRGVVLLYTLNEGRLYEVNEQVSWRRWDRYFCIVRDGAIVRMTKDEALQWLNDH